MHNHKIVYSESTSFCDYALWARVNKVATTVSKEIIPKSEDRRVKKIAIQTITKDKKFIKIYGENDSDFAQKTREASETDVEFIVNARAVYGELVARSIIMKRQADGSYSLIEVKLATSTKKSHIDEMTFAYYVFTNAGYRISNVEVWTINGGYKLDGELDTAKLFKVDKILSKILLNFEEIKIRVPIILEKVKELDLLAPPNKIGTYCLNCQYKEKCFSDEPNIFDFFGNDEASAILQESKSIEIKEQYLELIQDAKKKIELEALLKKHTYVNKSELKKFLDNLEYPLYFFDYECVVPIVPIFQNSFSYQHIPFQFSIHIQDTPDSEPRHYSFINASTTDPRKEVAENLVKIFDPLVESGKGSVIVYFKQYEMTRNAELAQLFPEYDSAIKMINSKIVDIYEVFKNRNVYSYKQNGSASIKSVLPAFTELSYDGMEIGNGLDAANSYLEYLQGNKKIEDIYNSLELYCQQDTYAMYLLLKVLIDLANK